MTEQMTSARSRGWACVQTTPPMWSYGIIVGNVIHYRTATVERRVDGSWNWWGGGHSGIEPSRLTAQQAAECFANRTA